MREIKRISVRERARERVWETHCKEQSELFLLVLLLIIIWILGILSLLFSVSLTFPRFLCNFFLTYAPALSLSLLSLSLSLGSQSGLLFLFEISLQSDWISTNYQRLCWHPIHDNCTAASAPSLSLTLSQYIFYPLLCNTCLNPILESSSVMIIVS